MRAPGGHKTSRMKYKGNAPGVFGESRRAWTRAFTLTAVLKLMPKPRGMEPGTDVLVTMNNEFGKISLELTRLRVDELTALKGLFDMAFAEAYPVCAQRDAMALEAFENGSGDFARVYRDNVTLWTREGERWAEGGHQTLRREWEGPDPGTVTKTHVPNMEALRASKAELEEDTSFNDTPTDD
ncbi:hypothetical protein SEA_HARAMBE_66 [Gordonia phage Harambe]|uniref:Uncharacterized protein n=1 Tax=Gordonia phage Harambe TaxID=2510575 RepID=A0A411B2V6_9CAUD|nr:hypothetical protein SEA_HARAMBE_66 [Gordonia phage Harambe]UXE04948.1 hypothetical protein SEA_JAMS_66 [Gordonia phage Jams]